MSTLLASDKLSAENIREKLNEIKEIANGLSYTQTLIRISSKQEEALASICH